MRKNAQKKLWARNLVLLAAFWTAWGAPGPSQERPKSGPRRSQELGAIDFRALCDALGRSWDFPGTLWECSGALWGRSGTSRRPLYIRICARTRQIYTLLETCTLFSTRVRVYAKTRTSFSTRVRIYALRVLWERAVP